MPEALKEVLNSDKMGSELFHSLTDGNQRGLIYLLGQVKSIDKRIKRVSKIVERIKNGVTSPRLILKK
jgi:uncharacterized protein YdeI (YjbR/CyaY-like superfamily)